MGQAVELEDSNCMFEAGQKLEIDVLGQQHRFTGVVRQTDDDHLLICIPPGCDDLFTEGVPVSLTLSNGKGLFQMDTRVLKSKAGQFVVKRTRPCLIQRRRTARVPGFLPVRFCLGANVEDAPGCFARDGERATTVDLSIGGLRLRMDHILFSGVNVLLEIRMEDDHLIIVEGVVVRSAAATEKPGEPEGRYLVSIRFTRVTRVDQLEIQKFVSKMQVAS
jgi:hypothetical protein